MVGVPDVRVPNGLIPGVGPAVEHSEVPFSQAPLEYDVPPVQGYSRSPQRLREYGGRFPGADEVGREYRHAPIAVVAAARGVGSGSDVLGGEGVPRRPGLLPPQLRQTVFHGGYARVRGDDPRDVGETLAVAEGVIRLREGIELVEVIYDSVCRGHDAYLLAATIRGRRGRAAEVVESGRR